MDVMTPLLRRVVPVMNRDTVANVKRAGYGFHKVDNRCLDAVKTIVATLPA